MRNLIDELRLLMAELLIRLAAKIAPPLHPDSLAIYAAALTIAHDED